MNLRNYAIISFLAFYIALVFVMATATLLAIQQLSDSEKYKYRYELLKKLGVDEIQINKTIFKQLFFYFAIPMLVPVLVSIPAIFSVGQLFTIAVTVQEIWRNFAIILGIKLKPINKPMIPPITNGINTPLLLF